jgi:hypothetical protein
MSFAILLASWIIAIPLLGIYKELKKKNEK